MPRPSHQAGAAWSSTSSLPWLVPLALAVLGLCSSSSSVFVSAASSWHPTLSARQQGRAVSSIIEHHSFSPPLLRHYYGDGEVPHWILTGAAVVTDNYVRLTPNVQDKTGHFTNMEPFDLDAFELVVGFRVHKPSGDYGADGFGIWISEIPRTDGPLLGHPAVFTGLGIVFDSFDNDNKRDNPTVGLLYNDGKVAGARFSPEKDFFGEYKGSCVFDYRMVSPSTMATARILFKDGQLALFLSTDSEVTEKECFNVSNVPLPVGRPLHLSLSAATGGVSDMHDIYFVHLSPREGVEYRQDVHEPVKPHGENMEILEETNEEKPSPPQHVESRGNNDAHQANAGAEAEQYQEAEERALRAEVEAAKQHAANEEQDRRRQQEMEEEGRRQRQQQQQQQQRTAEEEERQRQRERELEAERVKVSEEKKRLEQLEKELAELRRQTRRNTRRNDNDDDADYEDDDYEDEEPRRTRRTRRARTVRRRRVEDEDDY